MFINNTGTHTKFIYIRIYINFYFILHVTKFVLYFIYGLSNVNKDENCLFTIVLTYGHCV